MATERDSKKEEALIALAARRWRVAVTLTAVMMAVYFGFLLLVAFAKPTAGTLVAPGLSLGILLGALVIVAAWIVTGIYVRWANTRYDVELANLKMRNDDTPPLPPKSDA
jgi:uncharacterized membrane protein (DUF485 family)